MEQTKKTEFSLLGLSRLLEEHGFRVTEGKEHAGLENGYRCPTVLRRAVGRKFRYFEISEISLTVAFEKELADDESPSASDATQPEKG